MSVERETVTFYSHGTKVVGTLRLPDGAAGPVPAIVQGPGWLGLRDAKLYEPYHEALLAAGFAVLVFDYRGFGDSEGDATLPRSAWPRSRTTAPRPRYLEGRPEIDAARLGVFGSGGTGGGNAVMAAAPRPRGSRRWSARSRSPTAATGSTGCAASTSGSSSSDSVREDRRARTHGRRRAMVAAARGDHGPDPRAADDDGQVRRRRPSPVAGRSWPAPRRSSPTARSTSSTGSRPGPLMLIAVEHDATTPEDHAYALYERAGGPKRLVVQTGTTHYAAYAQYRDVVNAADRRLVLPLPRGAARSASTRPAAEARRSPTCRADGSDGADRP